eukprot:1569702-Prymnesium_polylepis.1
MPRCADAAAATSPTSCAPSGPITPRRAWRFAPPSLLSTKPITFNMSLCEFVLATAPLHPMARLRVEREPRRSAGGQR